MRILFDTNILIHIEDNKELSLKLQTLLKIFRQHSYQLAIHPLSLKEVGRNRNSRKRKILLSKLSAYPPLNSPPQLTEEFETTVGKPRKINDRIDNSILFAIFKNAADFLLTEDIRLLKKAKRAGLDNRALSLDSAFEYFSNLHARQIPKQTPLRYEYVYNLDIKDPFFDSLKKDYGEREFTSWFNRISTEERKCWVYYEGNAIKSLLIIKEETETINTNPLLPKAKRLKICTLKVDTHGVKLGELLLKIALQFCVKNNIFETYLTHYPKQNDRLPGLLTDYGFIRHDLIRGSEKVYLKNLIPADKSLTPIELARRYYPSFNDTETLKKFIVPIKPEYHCRLFPELENQLRIFDEINVPGNAIKKAYLCHSHLKKINSGDILLFYRSHDLKKITSIGIVDQKPIHTQNIEDIIRLVGNRTVYSYDEIALMTRRPILVILFRHHLDAKNFIKPPTVPQSIIEISHEQYLNLKKGADIDEHFTVS